MQNRREFLNRAGLSLLGMYTLGLRGLDPKAYGTFTVAAAGDCLITRKLSVVTHEPFLELAEMFREADVGFGNCEMTLHELPGYPAPTGSCGDLNLFAEPVLADELAGVGFTMMSLANNHAGDYGPQGLLATLKNLERAGVVAAGAGINLTEARAPRYRDAASGRVALIACASSFRAGTEATPSHAAIPGKPGLSPLRTSRLYRVRREQLESLRAIREDLGGYPTESEGTERVRFLGNVFEAAERSEVVTEASSSDIEEILSAIRRARLEADLVLLSIHAHQQGARREEPAAFLTTFARKCIEAGADIIIGHGPHVIRGIELYAGKPIFYSLGNFLFQAETIRQIPEEIYRKCELDNRSPSSFFAKVMGDMFEKPVFWEGVAPRVRFEGGTCVGIDLYPVDLRWKLPPTQRGTPELASGETAETILTRLADLSQPYETKLEIKDGLGLVVL